MQIFNYFERILSKASASISQAAQAQAKAKVKGYGSLHSSVTSHNSGHLLHEIILRRACYM